MKINDKPILVAVSLESRFKIVRALGQAFELQFVSTCKEAEALLNKPHSGGFGMILASLDFDESRLFEFLNFMREVDHFDDLPFVVIQLVPGKPLDMVSVKAALEHLGAIGFVHLQDMSEEQSLKALLDTVLVSFMKPVKYHRMR